LGVFRLLSVGKTVRFVVVLSAILLVLIVGGLAPIMFLLRVLRVAVL
jgi:hypothetical protein